MRKWPAADREIAVRSECSQDVVAKVRVFPADHLLNVKSEILFERAATRDEAAKAPEESSFGGDCSDQSPTACEYAKNFIEPFP